MENILSLKQVDTLINNTSKMTIDHDHKTVALLFKIMYHGMLWVSEVIELTPNDINYKNNEITVRNTRGGKVTTATFSLPSLWQEIMNYIKDLPPNEKLFSITRQTVWAWSKKLGEISQFKVIHMTKETDNIYNTVLRDSRKRHLHNSGVFRESEIDQLARDSDALNARGFGESPYSISDLKIKESNANRILLTYCEICDYKNPERSNFCCICGKSLTEEKSIIK